MHFMVKDVPAIYRVQFMIRYAIHDTSLIFRSLKRCFSYSKIYVLLLPAIYCEEFSVRPLHHVQGVGEHHHFQNMFMNIYRRSSHYTVMQVDKLTKCAHIQVKGSLTVWALYAYFSDSQNAAFELLVWCM